MSLKDEVFAQTFVAGMINALRESGRTDEARQWSRAQDVAIHIACAPAPVAAAVGVNVALPPLPALSSVEPDVERALDEIAVAVLGQHHAYTPAELAQRVREIVADLTEAANERNDALADVSELRREVEELTASLTAARADVARLTDERDAARWRGQVEPVTAERSLKVGDRVRLNDATVRAVPGDGGNLHCLSLAIDGERDEFGKAAPTAVYIGAIAGRVRS